jgi:hypothetical protein
MKYPARTAQSPGPNRPSRARPPVANQRRRVPPTPAPLGDGYEHHERDYRSEWHVG